MARRAAQTRAEELGWRVGCLLRVVLVVVPVGGLAASVAWSFGDTIGRNVTRAASAVNGLPDAATHISYFLPGAFGPVKFYEFDAPRADVVRWAAGPGWPLAAGGPKSISRFGCGTNTPADPRKVTVDAGLVYEWANPAASDDRLTVIYDSATGRTYVERSYR